MRPRRACLSVPASSPKFLAKAQGVLVDALFFDLEDSVAPTEKAAARQNVLAALRESTFSAPSKGVRINGLSTPFVYSDVTILLSQIAAQIDFIVVPKVESEEEVKFLDRLLSMLEAEQGLPNQKIGLDLQIETARGLREVFRIASASARIEALTFGPADMGASLGLPTVTAGAPIPGYEGLDHFHYALSQINAAAKAQGLQAIDGPYLQIKDLEGLRASAKRARALGLDGKWALHPDQIPTLQEVFSPSEAEVAHAKALLAHYQKSLQEDLKGAVMFGKEMIDEASRKQAEMILARAQNRS